MIGGALLVVAGFLITTLAPTPPRSGTASEDTSEDGDGLDDAADSVSDVDNELDALAAKANPGFRPAPSPTSEDGDDRAQRHVAASV